MPVHFQLVEVAWLRAHEETDKEHVELLARRIERDGYVEAPIVADRASGVILDGHHRVAALQQLGCSTIPAYLVPYDHASIVVDSWRDTPAPTKDDVLRRAAAGHLFPVKTTRHERVRHLPMRPTPLAQLRRR